MSYYALVKKSVANSAAAATEIRNALVTSMGWTEHDDRSGQSPPYYVFSSQGESGSRPTVYIKMTWSDITDKIDFNMYLHWNNTTHAGTVRLGPDTYYRLSSDDDSAFTLWVYGNKDRLALISKVGTAYMMVGLDYIDSFYKGFGTLASGVTAGNDKVLQLGTGEADDFVVGQNYQVAGSGSGEGRERPQVTVVTPGSHQVTVDNLARALSAGSTIARVPFPWLIIEFSNSNYYAGLINDHEGTTDENGQLYFQNPFSYNVVDPNAITGKNDFWHDIIIEQSQAPYGYVTHLLRVFFAITYEDTIGVDEEDSGTADATSTTTALDDMAKSWTTNEWAGYCLILTSGTNAGEMRKITSNTATQLVVPAFTVAPDVTTGYVIAKKGYRYFGFGTNSRSCAFKEVDGGV